MFFSCFDFRLRSEIPLGELTPADDPDDARPIVEIRLDKLPELLTGAPPAVHGLQAANGEALLTVTGNARYLIREGREIVVDPLPGAAERNVRLFLLGSALGILVYQRGLLPLHANAIVVEGGAVAFTGQSGAGKSTLAAHFQRAGYPVLCDDVCVVGFDDAGVPLAWPGLPRLKLWEDAAHAFGHDPAALDRAVEGLEKFHVPIGRTADARPVPLRRLYTLARAEDGEGRILPLRGSEAMAAVMENSYRGLYLPTLGATAAHFRQCAMLLRHVEVFAATRAWGFDVFEREAAMLERHAAGAA
ncbi:hypothetical protein LZK98_16855 [Sphingomonas cannabina]|uniref:hypothetical protein n=1 Tax=Sphingomonas cannabina TaxID=2899123 RepID=UPI001F31A13B|nr:hypothetical protein [Sphingomonas cannabina]UIJ44705.1 hypothetical protein LZK98_16855 [Sphingomonas cannabina]